MEDFFAQLSNMDWADFAAYGALTAGAAGTLGALFSQTFYHTWRRVEKPIRFIVSTLVLFTLWYSTLRIHISLSMNLDHQHFDEFLWYSAIAYTPVYLLTYRLETVTITLAAWIFEMLLDLLILSWFPELAETNRSKWKVRFSNVKANLLKALTGKVDVS